MGSPASGDVLEFRRRLAIARAAEGYPTQAIADFLGVDPRSVRRWLAASRDHGDEGLAARPRPGRPPQLTTTEEKIMLRWLSDLPSEHGFTTDLWSAPRLAQLVEEECGAHFHPNYLTTWLRQRGYTPPKPRRVAREPNDAAMARWLAEDWPRSKQKARRRGACLLWLDESGLLMAPLVRRGWALRGQPPRQKQKVGHREKVSVAAALWLPPLRDRLQLAYQTLVNGYFTHVEVAEFLSCAVPGLPDPVIAIWDCGTMHQGGPIRALWAESQGRLDIEPLPP
jgi:transposase